MVYTCDPQVNDTGLFVANLSFVGTCYSRVKDLKPHSVKDCSATQLLCLAPKNSLI